MRTRFLLLLLTFIAVGCSALQPAPTPSATAIVYPKTWTPAPTSTRRPPAPTATLVIQTTPTAAVSAKTLRRYPDPAYNRIGAWADTTNLNPDFMRDLAPRVELVLGPRAFALKLLNPRALALAQVDAAIQPATIVTRTQIAARSADGVLVEHVAEKGETSARAAAEKMFTSLRGVLGTRLLIAGSYAWEDGAAYQKYNADAQALLPRVDGVCVCSFLRRADAPLATFREEIEWKKDVDALAALSRAGNVVLVATRFSAARGEDVNALPQWFDYALTSFLLGADSAYSYFSLQGPRADDFMTNQQLSAALGYPLGPYYASFGLYQRRFQRGLVVVNPGNRPRALGLARFYITPLGQRLDRVEIEPHRGIILLMPND